MEREVEFDFSKRKEIEDGQKPKFTEKTKKNVKFIAFLLIGSIGFGSGYHLTTGFVQGYLSDKIVENNISIEKSKSDNILQQKKNEYNLELQKKKDAQNAIDEEKQRRINEQDQLLTDKSNYNLLVKNKDDLIRNYESQLTIYDKAYQDAVKNVKDGLISLDDLTSIRDLYQEYKKSIHESINNIHNNTISFSHYQNLDDDSKKELNDELIKYQNGDLNRFSDLENQLINTVGDNSNDDEDNVGLSKRRNTAKNQMIDDLAKVMSNDNVTTTTKKLKR